MKHDIVLSGVGGQGILTIAKVLSIAAVAKGLNVKQAEVHGLSQRGGAVYSHLRISDAEIYSDLIPAGKADMILAIEPLEALRYVEMLRRNGVVIASTNAVTDMPSYPPIESVLDRITAFQNHISIDMEKLGRAAGSPLAANIVALGAASLYLEFEASEIETAIEQLLLRKGARLVDANIRAFRFGRTAGRAYREALARGMTPHSVRSWVESLSAENLASEEGMEMTECLEDSALAGLSGAEAHAFESFLLGAYDEGRRQLYEHEVYALIELVGAISPPRHAFIPKGSAISSEVIEQFPGERVVVKLVSAEVSHKSDVGAVVFVPKSADAVNAEIDRMVARHTQAVTVAGTLVVEFVEHAGGLGSELFVGIRASREFGPVIAAGLGGVKTEYLAAKMTPGTAVAKAAALDTEPEEFLEMFKLTAAYDVLAGRIRGSSRIVSDGELLRCFRAFISIARRFCVDRGEEGPDIAELEVNPFAFRNNQLVPLDGRGSLRPAYRARAPRSRERVKNLLEPKSIALVGVSSKPDGLGRIVLRNILRAGFPSEQLTVVKADTDQIDGVKCVPTISDLAEPVDLLIVAAPAASVPDLVRECNASGKVHSGILVSGGAGESAGTESIGEALNAALSAGRELEGGGAVFLGPNCMGIRSVSGRFDTLFIPPDKLVLPTEGKSSPLALVSQSGAFVVSRLSALAHLNPRFAVSIGNQIDVTVSDVLHALADRDDLKVVGVYLEGFADLDGVETLRAIEKWTSSGRTVVFYKAGRTEKGRSAAAGHTAAIAGDFDICNSALTQAGALVAADFHEFNGLVETATALAQHECGGGRLFAVTNAGMESVAMADAVDSDEVWFAKLSDGLTGQLNDCLERHRLESLVSTQNPLDITPVASEAAYDEVVRIALASDEVDALIVAGLPFAPCLKTLGLDVDNAEAFPALAAQWLSLSSKPIVFVIDAGSDYAPLIDGIRAAGMPVLQSADEAVRWLSRWIISQRRNAARARKVSEDTPVPV